MIIICNIAGEEHDLVFTMLGLQRCHSGLSFLNVYISNTNLHKEGYRSQDTNYVGTRMISRYLTPFVYLQFKFVY